MKRYIDQKDLYLAIRLFGDINPLGKKMWRSLFLALGITAILVGTQLFFVEQLEIKRVRGARNPAVANNGNGFQNNPYQQASWQQPTAAAKPKTILFKPKDWMPWSLLAVGSIVVIYTFTIPGRTQQTE